MPDEAKVQGIVALKYTEDHAFTAPASAITTAGGLAGFLSDYNWNQGSDFSSVFLDLGLIVSSLGATADGVYRAVWVVKHIPGYVQDGVAANGMQWIAQHLLSPVDCTSGTPEISFLGQPKLGGGNWTDPGKIQLFKPMSSKETADSFFGGDVALARSFMNNLREQNGLA